MSGDAGQVVPPTRFLTVGFGTPIDIALLPAHPGGSAGELLTVGWRARFATTYLPYDPDEEQVKGG